MEDVTRVFFEWYLEADRRYRAAASAASLAECGERDTTELLADARLEAMRGVMERARLAWLRSAT